VENCHNCKSTTQSSDYVHPVASLAVGRSRCQLPGPCGPERGPGPKYVAYVFAYLGNIFVCRGCSVGIATTGWPVRDRIPVRTRLSARPDRPWGLPSLLYNGYRVFPGGKVRPRRAADHSPSSSAAVMEQ